jgi:hypothetical protein
VTGSRLSLVDLEISGASVAAVSFGTDASGDLIGSEIHDNPGAALSIFTGATPRITHTTFGRNGTAQNTPNAFIVEKGAVPVFQRNVFHGLSSEAFVTLDGQARNRLEQENSFVTPGVRRP